MAQFKLPQVKGLTRHAPRLADFTTLKVGGEALGLVEASDREDLLSVLEWAESASMALFFLGEGSNLLFSDAGFPGLIVKLGKEFRFIESAAEKDWLRVGGNTLKQDLLRHFVKQGYQGGEFFAGIPGNVAGGITMNAGTYLGDFSQIVQEVTLMERDGRVRVISGSDLCFSYRSQSFVKKAIILECKVRAVAGNISQIRTTVTSFLKRRRQTQPVEYPSCGSVFKNPEGFTAGQLIQTAGLKGKQIGGAMVSPKHANFFVNVGGARACDFLNLIDNVKEVVWAKYQILLHEEVQIVGMSQVR